MATSISHAFDAVPTSSCFGKPVDPASAELGTGGLESCSRMVLVKLLRRAKQHVRACAAQRMPRFKDISVGVLKHNLCTHNIPVFFKLYKNIYCIKKKNTRIWRGCTRSRMTSIISSCNLSAYVSHQHFASHHVPHAQGQALQPPCVAQ